MARKKQEVLVLFPEIIDITEKMSSAQFGELMRAVFAYRFSGVMYSGEDLAVDVAFRAVVGQINQRKEER